MNPPIYPCIRSLSYPSTYSSNHPSVHPTPLSISSHPPPTHPPIHTSIHSSTHPRSYLSTHHTPCHVSTPLSLRPPIPPSLHLSPTVKVHPLSNLYRTETFILFHLSHLPLALGSPISIHVQANYKFVRWCKHEQACACLFLQEILALFASLLCCLT